MFWNFQASEQATKYTPKDEYHYVIQVNRSSHNGVVHYLTAVLFVPPIFLILIPLTFCL